MQFYFKIFLSKSTIIGNNSTYWSVLINDNCTLYIDLNSSAFCVFQLSFACNNIDFIQSFRTIINNVLI